MRKALSFLASRLTGALHLTQRQVRDDAIRASLLIYDDLVHPAKYALERFQIDAAPRDLGGLLVFLIDLQIALGAPARLGDSLFPVALCILQNLLRFAPGFRYDAIGIGFRFVSEALLIGLCSLDVAESGNDLGRRVDLQQVDLGNLNTGIVAVEDALDEVFDLLLDLLAA